MKFPSKHVLNAMALAAAVLTAGVAGTPALAAPAATERAQQWSAMGGTVGMRWNRDLAGDLGLKIGGATGARAQLGFYEHEVFELRQSGSLDFTVRNGNLHRFTGGQLQAQGGYVIEAPGGRLDLSDFRLVPRRGTALLDLVGADGKAWFYVDRLMYELTDRNQRLAVRTMDLRIAPELAQRLGQPEVANWVIADMEFMADVVRQGALDAPRGSTKWHGLPVPGVAGATYQADLFMQNFSMQYSRCDTCTGAGGNGRVVFTPSSTLRNNVNNGSLQATVAGDPLGTSSALYTADIPWYQKFSGNFAPYGNDQHPYLIWNLYRLNADGSIDQIGRSGVKHAFLTINTACLDDPGDSHILGRGCSDVYGVGNNDSTSALGPRSEIIASTNQWGRCGSIYDTNCDGISNGVPADNFANRLIVRESQFSGAAHTGATYLFESWYLARQDVNIYNSMATVRATFSRPNTTWVVGGNDQYKLGPAIDRWVNPSAPGANARNVAVATPEGNVKVAVKTTDLGGGRWRYDYAVMNLDFSRARTEGAEPNLRVTSNLGFDNFSVPIGTATVSDFVFGDGDLDASNDWVVSVRDGRLYWTSAVRNNALNWGTMFRFSFIANAAPAQNAVTMHIAADNTREVVTAPGVLAPAGAALKAAAAR
ncbi:MAG: hypothetical protein JNM33_15520 [Rubrivivax sp.]|nr:hypothetical protein [Rubrivivax sp.]